MRESMTACITATDKLWEARLVRAFRMMPEAARGMLLRVAESYEVELIERPASRRMESCRQI